MADSPVKKINFGVADKENALAVVDVPVESEVETKKESEETKSDNQLAVAPTIKPEEADEPLLQENPQRFVLFPIKYHEVRVVASDAFTR